MRQCEEAVVFSERVCDASAHLDAEAGHLHPKAVGEGLQASLGDAVGSHVQAGEEGEDAGGVDHPTCNTQGHAENGPRGRRRRLEGSPLTFGGADQRQEGDGGPDGAVQVDVQHVVEVLDGAPLYLGPVGDSGVVHDGPQS